MDKVDMQILASLQADGRMANVQLAEIVGLSESPTFRRVKLLEEAGCTVEVPNMQTCCGQSAYNSGDRKTSREIAEQTIRAFETRIESLFKATALALRMATRWQSDMREVPSTKGTIA